MRKKYLMATISNDSFRYQYDHSKKQIINQTNFLSISLKSMVYILDYWYIKQFGRGIDNNNKEEWLGIEETDLMWYYGIVVSSFTGEYFYNLFKKYDCSSSSSSLSNNFSNNIKRHGSGYWIDLLFGGQMALAVRSDYFLLKQIISPTKVINIEKNEEKDEKGLIIGNYDSTDTESSDDENGRKEQMKLDAMRRNRNEWYKLVNKKEISKALAKCLIETEDEIKPFPYMAKVEYGLQNM